MDNKKEQILHAAMRFFSDKGYYETSVQEIAEDVGISKGSLYKYFQSKEELFIKVFEYFQNNMFEKATNTKYDNKLNAKEILQFKILIQMEDFLDKKDFIMLQFKEIPIRNNEQLKPLLRKMKVRMMNWHKQSLLEAYGRQVENYIWDIVIIYQGIIKEYLMLMINENKHLPLQKLANSIVKRMDAVVNSYQEEENPLLSESTMSDFSLKGVDLGQTSIKETLNRVITDLRSELSILKRNDKDKDELLSSLSLLEEELGKEEPKMFLVHALLSYLEKEGELKGYIYHIEKLISM